MEAIGRIILQIPIIGDIYFILIVFWMACVVFGVVIGPIEYIAKKFFKTSFILPSATVSGDKVNLVNFLSNSLPINLWLYLLVAINSLAIRYNFKNLNDVNDKNDTLFIFLLWLVGLIPGIISYKKGRNFFNWWMYGHLLFIVALPHALLLRETEDSLINKGILKKCSYCAEAVKKEAKVCKHCGNQLVC
jgi:hypothetical protein